MQITHLIFAPRICLQLTEQELLLLLKLSELHYDSHCKQASKQGGFLYGARNCYYNGAPTGEGTFDPSITCEFTWGQVDTMAKICEVPLFGDEEGAKVTTGMMFNFRRAMSFMNDKVPPAKEFTLDQSKEAGVW